MVCSMSRKANWRDNAPTGSFFNSLKNKQAHEMRYVNRVETMADIFEHIKALYNRKRRHSPLGYRLLQAYLQNPMSSQHEGKVAA